VSGLVVDTRTAGRVRFAVHVQPRASRTELSGVYGGALKVRLRAPPVDGAANDALVEYLAAQLGLPRRAVRIVAGATSRAKTVDVEGATVGDILALAETGSVTAAATVGRRQSTHH
jgi:uncharacterized protein (TIGR00251 family)